MMGKLCFMSGVHFCRDQSASTVGDMDKMRENLLSAVSTKNSAQAELKELEICLREKGKEVFVFAFGVHPLPMGVCLDQPGL